MKKVIRELLIKLLREPNMNLRYSTYYSYVSVPRFIFGPLATLNQRFLSCVSIALLLAVAGCATVDPKAVQSKTNGKSIAVVSTTGENLNLMWIGTTVFNNEYGTVSVTDWNMDKTIANKAVEELQNTKRYTNVFAVDGVTRASAGFPSIAADKKPDFVVLIEPTRFEDRAFGTNQSIKGVGVYQRSMFNSMRSAVGHAALKAEIFDAQSGQSLGTYGTLNLWPTSVSLNTGPTISDNDLSQFKKDGALSQIQSTVVGVLEKLGLR